MKPYLPPAPPTDEDNAIWLRLKGMGFPSVMPVQYMLCDRRDAAIMHTRTHRAAFVCAICWEFTAHEGCTVDHYIRMRRPFHPDSLGALLAEVLR